MGLAQQNRRVQTLTHQVMKACNVIRPDLQKLRQNPRISVEAKVFGKMLKSIQISAKGDEILNRDANVYNDD